MQSCSGMQGNSGTNSRPEKRLVDGVAVAEQGSTVAGLNGTLS